MGLGNLTHIDFIDLGSRSRSPEVKLTFFRQFCASLPLHSLCFSHLAPNILLGDKSISGNEPYSFWYISEVTRGHQGSNLARFHQFCASLPLHSLCYSHLVSNILLGDESICDHEPYSFWYILEVTRGQNWPFFINFVPRYHSTAFAFNIWLPIFYWVIKVLVIMNPIHFGTFRRSPEVNRGQIDSFSSLFSSN